MGTIGIISLVIPQIGQPDTTEDVKLQNALTTIQAAFNGNIDSTNLSAATSQSAGVNASGQTVKSAVNIATSESRTNVAYGTLTTPDQVTGIVMPSNGLIVVGYQATWQESVAGAARAAIFIGSNQLKVGGSSLTFVQAAATTATTEVNDNYPLYSTGWGLASYANFGNGTINYAGDVTTGQVLGNTSGLNGMDINGAGNKSSAPTGPCYIFAAAGTYTISVQFKASSGSVTASNRKLWVQALSFA